MWLRSATKPSETSRAAVAKPSARSACPNSSLGSGTRYRAISASLSPAAKAPNPPPKAKDAERYAQPKKRRPDDPHYYGRRIFSKSVGFVFAYYEERKRRSGEGAKLGAYAIPLVILLLSTEGTVDPLTVEPCAAVI